MPSLYSWSITWCNGAAVNCEVILNGKFKTIDVYKLDPSPPSANSVIFGGGQMQVYNL